MSMLKLNACTLNYVHDKISTTKQKKMVPITRLAISLLYIFMIYDMIYDMYVITRAGVIFGIYFTSCRYSGG